MTGQWQAHRPGWEPVWQGRSTGTGGVVRDAAQEHPHDWRWPRLPGWPMLSRSLPKTRAARLSAAAALAVHVLAWTVWMEMSAHTVPQVRRPAPSTSFRWVDVRLLPPPLQPLPPRASRGEEPTASAVPRADVLAGVAAPPLPLKVWPIPSVTISPLNETPSMEPSASAEAQSRTAASQVLDGSSGPNGPEGPDAPDTSTIRGQPQERTAHELPHTASERPAPPSVQDQPASLPADHRSCQTTQTARYYPALLRERGIQGLVRLRVKVDERGRAAEVLVAGGSGFRLLDEAARRVAESCPYLPARRGDVRVVSWIEYGVRFALSPAPPGSL